MDTNIEEYKKLLTEVIKKQIVILGPGIALVKAKNVEGIEIGDDGTVTDIKGDPASALQKLIDQYVSLSGLIVKKTMEPLLSKYPGISVSNGANMGVNQTAPLGNNNIEGKGGK